MMQEDALILKAYIEKQYQKQIVEPGKQRQQYWDKQVEERSIDLWTLQC